MTNVGFFIYGKEELSINSLASTFSGKKIIKIMLKEDLNITSENVVSYIVKTYPNYGDYYFFNADTIKKVNVKGLENIDLVINNTKGYVNTNPYIILLNRYLDSVFQTQYLGELTVNSGVSVFQSFNPGNSEAFYVPNAAMNIIKNMYKLVTIDHTKVNIKHAIFDKVRKGEFDAFSFNPNIYTFRLENSSAESDLQYLKSSIINHDKIMEERRLDRTISLFFSDRILLFWIFIVFFICVTLIITLKIFKLTDYVI